MAEALAKIKERAEVRKVDDEGGQIAERGGYAKDIISREK